MSVVNGGDYIQYIENKKKSIVEICIGTRSLDGIFLFDLAEPGRNNQCTFLHPKHLRAKAEAFFDSAFINLLVYG